MPEPDALEVGLRCSPGSPPLDTNRFAELLIYAARAEGRSGEVGVWLCSDDEIADLHLRFMQIPGPTDVISFPGDAEYLGDIAVSFDTAAEQAAEAGHPVARELAYLALHGLLHLLGYDDLTTPERDAMLARQDALIEAFEKAAPGGWA
ncbi:MAG TPA: rRNA maturation RNase YbeY [Nitrolancea sp.]|jgi:probable rRNA maturation factor|nr:rRNA maturation RNase YbeY [Nitrolancea sp.]